MRPGSCRRHATVIFTDNWFVTTPLLIARNELECRWEQSLSFPSGKARHKYNVREGQEFNTMMLMGHTVLNSAAQGNRWLKHKLGVNTGQVKWDTPPYLLYHLPNFPLLALEHVIQVVDLLPKPSYFLFKSSSPGDKDKEARWSHIATKCEPLCLSGLP